MVEFDLIVDHLQHAAIERGLAVRVECLHAHRATRQRAVDLAQLLLRQSEQNRDRPYLGDDDNAGVGGAYQVAFVHHANAGAAVDRRHDGGIVEESLGVGDSGVVQLDLGGELRDQRALRIDGLLRHDIAAERVVAFQVALGVVELHFVEGLLGHGLIELRLIGGRIDLGQHVAALDVLPLLEIEREDAPVDLRPHRNEIACLGRADAI